VVELSTTRSKNYWDNRINAPLTPNSMLCEWLKRGNSTHSFQHWSWGQGGGRRTLKWPKMWKVSLFVHAIVWDGAVCGFLLSNIWNFAKLYRSSWHEIDIFQSINRKFFVPQNVEILQEGCAGDWARIKKLF
jgi:hypothetical protein